MATDVNISSNMVTRSYSAAYTSLPNNEGNVFLRPSADVSYIQGDSFAVFDRVVVDPLSRVSPANHAIMPIYARGASERLLVQASVIWAFSFSIGGSFTVRLRAVTEFSGQNHFVTATLIPTSGSLYLRQELICIIEFDKYSDPTEELLVFAEVIALTSSVSTIVEAASSSLTVLTI